MNVIIFVFKNSFALANIAIVDKINHKSHKHYSDI